MKKKITTLLLAVITVLLPVGCGGGNDKLLGKWTMAEGNRWISREFKDDGTIIERAFTAPHLRTEGTYTADGDKIEMTMTHFVVEESGESITIPYEIKWEFSYSVKRNKLTLIDLNHEDGEEAVYMKDSGD